MKNRYGLAHQYQQHVYMMEGQSSSQQQTPNGLIETPKLHISEPRQASGMDFSFDFYSYWTTSKVYRGCIDLMACSNAIEGQRNVSLELILYRQVIEADEIDRINILQATLRAMEVAVSALECAKPDFVLVDGNQLPKVNSAAHVSCSLYQKHKKRIRHVSII